MVHTLMFVVIRVPVNFESRSAAGIVIRALVETGEDDRGPRSDRRMINGNVFLLWWR
jgi:hypothetical protein